MDDRKIVRIRPWIDDPAYDLFLASLAQLDRHISKFYVVTFKVKGHGNKHFTEMIEAGDEMVALNKFLKREYQYDNAPQMPLFKPKEKKDE